MLVAPLVGTLGGWVGWLGLGWLVDVAGVARESGQPEAGEEQSQRRKW
jgi:hypothetical protein